jgi:hypothetical protein
MQTRRFPNAVGAAVAQTSVSVLGAASINDAGIQAIRFAGTMKGFVAMYFASGLPANWEMGASWMAQEWIDGRKRIWPGFAGVL